jgi:hypothetical protein
MKQQPELGNPSLGCSYLDFQDLKRRVLHDIVWIRERFHHAKLREPSDEDIIWWFDAGGFDEGVTSGDSGAEVKGESENCKEFLDGLMFGNLRFRN